MSERSPHPSLAQMNALIEFLEANPNIAKGYSKSLCARERTRRQWERLAVTLNSLGGSEKNARQWNKCWCDKKSAIKKKAAARSAARRKTGGDDEEIVELTEMEERVIALLGGKTFATGDSHLKIDPLAVPTPSSSGQAVESDCSEDSRIPHLGSSHSEDIDFTIKTEAVIPQEDDNDTMSIFSNNNHHQSSSLRDSGRQRSASILSTTTPTPPRTQQSNTTTLTQTQTCPPAQREVTSGTSPTVQSFSGRRTNSQVRRSHAPLSIRSSSRPSATNNRPPSQRRRKFAITVEKLMQLENQQMELQKQQVELQQTILERLTDLSEHMVERDRILTEALRDGFDQLTDAMKQNE